MKTEIANQWIEALRSGNYDQVRGNLRVNDSYCCLGLLCELVKEPAGLYVTIRHEYYDNSGRNVHKYAEESGVLPIDAREFVAMKSNDGVIKLTGMGLVFDSRYETEDIEEEAGYGEQRYSLAELNDEGFTFSQIADLIDYFKDEL